MKSLTLKKIECPMCEREVALSVFLKKHSIECECGESFGPDIMGLVDEGDISEEEAAALNAVGA